MNSIYFLMTKKQITRAWTGLLYSNKSESNALKAEIPFLLYQLSQGNQNIIFLTQNVPKIKSPM